MGIGVTDKNELDEYRRVLDEIRWAIPANTSTRTIGNVLHALLASWVTGEGEPSYSSLEELSPQEDQKLKDLCEKNFIEIGILIERLSKEK